MSSLCCKAATVLAACVCSQPGFLDQQLPSALLMLHYWCSPAGPQRR